MTDSPQPAPPAPERVSATQFCDTVLDPGSFVSWDTAPVRPAEPDEAYAASLVRAADRAGTDESVITGAATIDGRKVAVVVGEFAFLGGSIGVAAAERIVRTVERATAEELPLIAAPTSGGTRMQEGTLAFVQMVKIAAAVELHKQAHLPYLVYLRHPTTGGVFASWGAQGHVTFAQPGAMIGFLGPKVYAALYREDFPTGVQQAENLFRHGIVDAVVPVAELRGRLARALRVLTAASPGGGAGGDAGDAAAASPAPADPDDTIDPADMPDVPAWQSIMLTRRADRPGARVLAALTEDLVPLSGTGEGESESAMLLALARIDGIGAVVLGQDRTGQSPSSPMGPGALREARRAMGLAEQLRLPLVMVIDTVGAALSVAAEEGGLAPEIARCVADSVLLDTPVVSILLGQGTGGGALALLPADRVLCAQHSWLAPLPPEGASVIMHGDTSHAPQMAAAQGVRAQDLAAAGIVDVIIAEKPDAAFEPDAFATRVHRVVAAELRALDRLSPDLRRSRRLDRYRGLGLT